MRAYVKESSVVGRKSIMGAAVGLLLIAVLLATLVVTQPVRAVRPR